MISAMSASTPTIPARWQSNPERLWEFRLKQLRISGVAIYDGILLARPEEQLFIVVLHGAAFAFNRAITNRRGVDEIIVFVASWLCDKDFDADDDLA